MSQPNNGRHWFKPFLDDPRSVSARPKTSQLTQHEVTLTFEDGTKYERSAFGLDPADACSKLIAALKNEVLFRGQIINWDKVTGQARIWDKAQFAKR